VNFFSWTQLLRRNHTSERKEKVHTFFRFDGIASCKVIQKAVVFVEILREVPASGLAAGACPDISKRVYNLVAKCGESLLELLGLEHLF
jgi:hypothetical protein